MEEFGIWFINMTCKCPHPDPWEMCAVASEVHKEPQQTLSYSESIDWLQDQYLPHLLKLYFIFGLRIRGGVIKAKA